MKRKAQGLSLNVVIIAAIALIVLVVLVAIFTGRLGIFGQKVADVGKICTDYTETKGTEEYKAEWQPSACNTATHTQIVTATDADKYPGQYCCRKIIP